MFLLVLNNLNLSAVKILMLLLKIPLLPMVDSHTTLTAQQQKTVLAMRASDAENQIKQFLTGRH